jgi:hypothetical protein
MEWFHFLFGSRDGDQPARLPLTPVLWGPPVMHHPSPSPSPSLPERSCPPSPHARHLASLPHRSRAAALPQPALSLSKLLPKSSVAIRESIMPPPKTEQVSRETQQGIERGRQEVCRRRQIRRVAGQIGDGVARFTAPPLKSEPAPPVSPRRHSKRSRRHPIHRAAAQIGALVSPRRP